MTLGSLKKTNDSKIVMFVVLNKMDLRFFCFKEKILLLIQTCNRSINQIYKWLKTIYGETLSKLIT